MLLNRNRASITRPPSSPLNWTPYMAKAAWLVDSSDDNTHKIMYCFMAYRAGKGISYSCMYLQLTRRSLKLYQKRKVGSFD